MTTTDFRSLTAAAVFPLTIRTRGGKDYTVRSAHTFWISVDYPNLVFLASRGESVAILAIDAIDSVHPEHEAVTQRA